MVSVLVRVEKVGQGGEGGVGDGGVDRDLFAGLVPQHVEVDRGEQPCLEGGRQAVKNVLAVGQPVKDGGVGGPWLGGGEGGEAGFCFGALLVEFGEPVADAGAHGGCGGAVGVDVFQGGDLGGLLLVQLGDLRSQRGGGRVTARGGVGVGVGRGKLRGEQRRPARSKYPVVEETAGDGFKQRFGGLHAARVIGMRGDMARAGRVVRAAVVDMGGVGVGGHAAGAVPAGTGSRTFTVAPRTGMMFWGSCIGTGMVWLNSPDIQLGYGWACDKNGRPSAWTINPTHAAKGRKVTLNLAAPAGSRWALRVDATSHLRERKDRIATTAGRVCAYLLGAYV